MAKITFNIRKKSIEQYNILDYIETGYGIFHCEGDEAVLDDITELLERKGMKVNAGIA